mmetsp:Transcript_519/g.1116  ORF Transcript_519/g.1116 Transcript_519/m.1116 type:complete len:272 (+) Transcript_519:146-961(+)|eukprot:CAMPEP_0114293882 /NCGR_PEP_ID=MMETSP0059-20121206/9827_1 /TAXON_ID=36894 /ORGANISM="Pyramimonas parkeae, Strain CCMP726" /LENGTH=271 /DNA_ID=CAMNT_0001415617 /DNA_START=120 /DNA_END=935 /DNA_ORIENTATION=+
MILTRKDRTVLAVIILLSSEALNANGHTVPKEVQRCSRDKSRKARAILDVYLHPFLVESHKGNMSEECVLQPHRDMYREHELNKKEVRRSQWKCLFCSKMFRSEDYLDKHFDNRHLSAIPEGAEVCLGDYCDVLHCDHDHPVHSKFSALFSCKSSDMARRRHHCEAIAHKCFPPEAGLNIAHLHDFFVHQFCDAHTCESGRLLFPGGMGGAGNKWIYIMTFIMIVGLGILYSCIYLYQRDIPMAQDLRRVRPQKSKGWPWSWFAKKKKKQF